MVKNTHEVRDPIHVFVRLDNDERKVLNSRPFQRLRYITQLATSYLLYPGATHRRFEHSLGVMELAGRVFDVITADEAITDEIRKSLPEITQKHALGYWRRVLRMAALCHDLGHLPFSHAAEKELLPEGWNHERLTQELILDEELSGVFANMAQGPIRADHVAKLAVGQKKAVGLTFSNWEAILSEIIVGDAFGVDRIDYLLRDSHHTGVAYGRFDHYRLVDTLRILPQPPSPNDEASAEPALGVEEGGIHSAEALLLARYFMYSQVYFHPVRRIYDIHLKDFLREWLPGGKFRTDIPSHLRMTDNEVTAAIMAAADNPEMPGHDSAKRIVTRDHFRVLYERNPDDIAVNPEAGLRVFEAAKAEYGEENVRRDHWTEKGTAPEFPVLASDGRVVSSLSLSETLRRLPPVAVDYVFIAPVLRRDAEHWLRNHRPRIIQPTEESQE